MTFFAELKRRNVIRAGVLYAGAVWALAQGIAQLAKIKFKVSLPRAWQGEAGDTSAAAAEDKVRD